jgi:hypothetical protein
MSIIDRYASAVGTSDLAGKAAVDDTVYTDNDVIAAFGFAGHSSQLRENGDFRDASPLAAALARLFCGDNRAAHDIVQSLYCKAMDKAAALRIDIKRTQAQDMAKAVLAWHRDGVCKACGGHGFELIDGAPVVGDMACYVCHGDRKVPFGAQFQAPESVIAFWLLAEVEREQSKAGPIAMSKLALRLSS